MWKCNQQFWNIQCNVFIKFDVLGEIIYLVALLMQGLNAQAALAWTCQDQMLDHKKLMVVYCWNLQLYHTYPENFYYKVPFLISLVRATQRISMANLSLDLKDNPIHLFWGAQGQARWIYFFILFLILSISVSVWYVCTTKVTYLCKEFLFFCLKKSIWLQNANINSHNNA